jgi:spore coat protein CotH
VGDGNWSRFIELCRIIDRNKSDDETFNSLIPTILNIDQYVKYLCIEMFVSFYDGYTCGSNNFALYDNPETSLFEMIGIETSTI